MQKGEFYYLYSVPKYFLLVYEKNIEFFGIEDEHISWWIRTVLGNPKLQSMSETVLVFETNVTKNNLHVLCPYCNPCNKFQMISLTITVFQLKFILVKYTKIVGTFLPRSVDVIANEDYSTYSKDFTRDGKGSRSTLLKYLNELNISDAVPSEFPFLIDLHALTILLPANISVNLLTELNDFWMDTRIFSNLECVTSYVSTPTPFKFVPLLIRITTSNLAFAPELGLVFQNEQLRFVSCHSEQIHWIYNMNELIFVFDIATWLLMIASLIETALIYSLSIQHKSSKPFVNSCFSLSTCLLDQGSKMFHSHDKNFVLFFIPLIYILLGTYYKGENITNLTISPAFDPFDTFKELVRNKFTTYSTPVLLSITLYEVIKSIITLESGFLKISDHEAYPVISELWFKIMSHLRANEVNRLSLMGSQISNESWFYLNNSQLLPHRQNVRNEISDNTTYLMGSLHLYTKSCYKYAVILNKYKAIQLYTILKGQDKPAYYGKDILNENYRGYKYYSYFPTKIKWRVFHTV